MSQSLSSLVFPWFCAIYYMQIYIYKNIFVKDTSFDCILNNIFPIIFHETNTNLCKEFMFVLKYVIWKKYSISFILPKGKFCNQINVSVSYQHRKSDYLQHHATTTITLFATVYENCSGPKLPCPKKLLDRWLQVYFFLKISLRVLTYTKTCHIF